MVLSPVCTDTSKKWVFSFFTDISKSVGNTTCRRYVQVRTYSSLALDNEILKNTE